MPTSVPVPAAEMTQSPHPQPDEPHAATADAAEPAGRGPGLIRRACTAAKPAASTTALITVMVLLATGLGTFVQRELNSIQADLNSIEADINKLETEIDARFVKLETEMDARFAEVDARFDELDAKIDEIALTLAALVAYLRADEGVDAALSGVTGAGAGSDPAVADPATGP